MKTSDTYREASLEAAIIALDNKMLLEQIYQLAIKHHCQVSICMPRAKDLVDQIHFALYVDDTFEVSLFDKAEIEAFISDTLQYEKVVVNRITCDDATFRRLYQDDVTPITLDNYDQIHTFFIKNYPQAYSERQETKRSKRKRTQSTLFESASLSKTDVHVDSTLERVIEILQQDPVLWAAIKQEPDVLKTVAQHIKEGAPEKNIHDSTIK
ncbi:MAG: hypothetical protein AB7F64_07750 [Gammaproteobacteria bacterium]